MGRMSHKKRIFQSPLTFYFSSGSVYSNGKDCKAFCPDLLYSQMVSDGKVSVSYLCLRSGSGRIKQCKGERCLRYGIKDVKSTPQVTLDEFLNGDRDKERYIQQILLERPDSSSAKFDHY